MFLEGTATSGCLQWLDIPMTARMRTALQQLDFTKRRGKQSRPDAITYFVNRSVVQGRKLCTMSCICCTVRRGALTGLASAEINLRVVTVWEQTQTLCNMYLKCEEHLQLHEKEIVSQASQPEVVRTISVIGGLPAETSSFCQLPLQLQPPRDDQATRKSHGKGGADGSRQCARCKQHAAVNVMKAGHDCMLYLISIGKDSRQYSYTQDMDAKMGSLPTMEQALEECAAKKRKEWSRGKWQAEEAQSSVSTTHCFHGVTASGHFSKRHTHLYHHRLTAACCTMSHIL